MNGPNVTPIVNPNKTLHEKLALDGKRPAATIANILLILTMDERLKGIVSYDQFNLELCINRAVPVSDDIIPVDPGPYPRAWSHDTDTPRLTAYIQQFYISRCAKLSVEDAVKTIGHANGRHPVREWLDTLAWDGRPRLDAWLTHVYGSPLDGYHKAVASKFMIGAVRRVRHPGSKFDQMMVLEGEQDIGKSTSLRVLFGESWFSDQMAPLTSKDSSIDMRGKWCIEFGEIDHVIRTDVETVKAFLSRGVDHYRAPYSRTTADYPRQCVFVGTTNTTDYLRDHTGNRRFWPVACLSDTSVDLPWLKQNRQQLWAEAADREARGEPAWIDSDLIKNEAEKHQSDRYQLDPWADKITMFIELKTRVKTHEILNECLAIPNYQQTKAISNRVGAVLRQQGWKSITARTGDLNKMERFWQR